MFQELLNQEFPGLAQDQLDKLEQHYKLLSLWNKRLNLTRILDIEDAVRFHYCESLFLASLLPDAPQRVVDIGSGAGFPGIPVAVARRGDSVELAESHRRKAVFLREASRDLPNITVRADRAENLSTPYDWVVARAVRPIDVLALRLAANVAILMSADDLADTVPFSIEKVPWGHRRVVAMFHVKQK